MNVIEITKKIEEAKKILDECLDVISGEEGKTKMKLAGKPSKKHLKIKGGNEDLYLPIEKLFQGGFFKDWHTDLDVCNTLTLKLLTKKTPLRASVVNVLRAMVKKEALIRDKIKKDKKEVFAYKQS